MMYVLHFFVFSISIHFYEKQVLDPMKSNLRSNLTVVEIMILEYEKLISLGDRLPYKIQPILGSCFSLFLFV